MTQNQTATIDPIKQVILDLPAQIVKALEIIGTYALPDPVEEIVIVGMGGSGIAGNMLCDYLRNEKIRIDLVNDYTLPAYVGRKTLVMVCSYSGNTEETVAAYKEASKRRAKTLGFFSGGKLHDIFKIAEKDFFIIPEFPEPRYSSATMFFMMLRVLENSKIIPSQVEFIKETIKALKTTKLEEVAQNIALTLRDKIPLVYATPRLASVAYRWKCDFNENSEIHAFNATFPELCHNELVGFRKNASSYHVIILKDAQETAQMKKRVEATKEIIKSRGFSTTEILITGSNELSRMFSAFMIGSLASYFLAKELGIDPRKAEAIYELKAMLKK